jgi:predicted nucleic acid-binding protein
VKYLLDSTVLIDLFNGVDAAEAFLLERGSDSAISVVTVAEVLTGSLSHEIERHELVLEQFPCLGIDLVTAKGAAALRQLHRWKMADAFQAALALRHGLKLVTRNTRDFRPVKHPFVHVPYTFRPVG